MSGIWRCEDFISTHLRGMTEGKARKWFPYLAENGADGSRYVSAPDGSQIPFTSLQSRQPTDEQMDFLYSIFHRSRHFRKKCFANSQRTVIYFAETGRFTYWEGGLITDPSLDYALHHAWVVLDGQIVVEQTTRVRKGVTAPGSRSRGFLRDRPVGLLPEGWRYWGVPIPTRAVSNAWAAKRFIGPMIGMRIELHYGRQDDCVAN